MKKILMALIVVGSLLAVVGPVYAGGADSDGVGYHCYLFGEREDTADHNFRKNFWQFMTHDEDASQVEADVVKKMAKATSKSYEIVASMGNHPVTATTFDPATGGTKQIKVCCPDPDECAAATPGVPPAGPGK